ncbi:hypothetical protein Tco_1181228 [Tanacetum coccineum]
MADHSQKWHDGTSSRNIESSSSLEGIAAIVNKLENLRRDMKKLKENVHAFQVGCQICEGAHLDKDCPFYEEIKNFVILDMVEDIQMPIILGRPLLATAHAKESYEEIVHKLTEVEKENYSALQEKNVHWCKAILQENENECQYLSSYNPNSNICDGGDLPINVEKHYWKSNNDNEQEELEWENLSLHDWMRIRYGKVCKMIGERILKDYWR